MFELTELEFSKNGLPTPNPLHEIQIDETVGGNIAAIPAKARVGESVKLVIEPDRGFNLEKVEALDEQCNKLGIDENAQAPYAPQSFNFQMPNRKVRINSKFEQAPYNIKER